MQKRLYLVAVSDPMGYNKFLPLALGYLWSFAKNDDWTLCDVYIEKDPIDQIVASMSQPDIVGLSSYVWNWEFNKKLATAIKKKWPTCQTIVGGPHISKHDPNWFDKHPQIDLAIHGEGELAWQSILKSYPGPYNNIPHVQTPTHMPDKAQRIRDLTQIPSPILEGFYDPIMAKYPKDTSWNLTIETLRGCPYHCSFCDIGDEYWNKLSLFPMDRVLKEIDWIGQNKIEYVYCCDSNWGMLERDKEITKYVLDTKAEYGYPKFWDVTWAKNNHGRNFEIAKMNKEMSKTDFGIFKGVTLAVQSMHEPTLKAIDRWNMNDDKMKQVIDKYNAEGIPTYGELIWPMPEETVESLRDNIQKFIDLNQDNFLQVNALVIEDNGEMGRPEYQKKWGLQLVNGPLDNMHVPYDKNRITEYSNFVYSTRTANWEQVLEGHMFQWIAVLMYWYGWGQGLAKYMLNQHGIKATDLYETLRKWILKNEDTLLYEEYKITEQCIYDTHHSKAEWGRTIYGDNDLQWEYKSATSVMLHNNRKKFAIELERFLVDEYNLDDAKEIVRLNLGMCVDHDTKYPIQIKTDSKIAKQMLGIEKNIIEFDHWDKDAKDESINLWHQKAYHRLRKVRYWYCEPS